MQASANNPKRGDAAGGGQEAHGFPITAVERKRNPHPLAVVSGLVAAALSAALVMVGGCGCEAQGPFLNPGMVA
jgi:hypothetical protein